MRRSKAETEHANSKLEQAESKVKELIDRAAGQAQENQALSQDISALEKALEASVSQQQQQQLHTQEQLQDASTEFVAYKLATMAKQKLAQGRLA